jgi:hypothetical protein
VSRKRRRSSGGVAGKSKAPASGFGKSGGDNVGIKQIAPIIIVVLLAGIGFSYGKYLEFNTNDPFDGSLNVYSAQCIANGQKIGVDVFPSARPATLLVNVVGVSLFGFSEFGPKLIQMLMQLAAFGLMFYTLRRIYGLLPAGVALILAGFYLSCPPYAKYGNVKEQFMIACMIISACSLMLHHVGLRWWWLILSGGAAINAFYFKPTGASLIIAMVVYLPVQGILRHRKWRRVGIDVLAVLGGACVGIIPLACFYIWQGRWGQMARTIPFLALKTIVPIALVGLVIYSLFRGWRRYIQPRLAGQLRWWIWAGGSGILAIVFVGFAIYFAFKGELLSYLKDIPVLGYCLKLPMRISMLWGKAIGLATGGSGYVESAKSVSVFKTQYDWVIKYYRFFVVPIGLSLCSIFWYLGRGFMSLLQRRKSSDEPGAGAVQADYFVLLLGVWWILDMLFIWVSPRSYVQYFLPLNASAAMLSAYAIYRCQKRPVGFIFLLGGWLVVDFLLRWIVPADGFGYVTFRTSEAVGAYWGGFFVRLIPLAAAVGAYVLLKSPGRRKVLAGVMILLCAIMTVWWNTENIQVFSKRVKNLQQGQITSWEPVAEYIQQRSLADDGLYVWGWLPGIYVQAQRFSPAKQPAYSDMHVDPPEIVGYKITALVEQLKSKPPKYIVDSQKFHYPYYDHPNFDLWPRWTDKKKRGIYLRFHPSQPLVDTEFLSVKEYSRLREPALGQIEEFTNMRLTDSRRKGGAVEAGKARQMAQMERQRHEGMLALREFVMANYQMVPLRSSIYVFKYRGSK